MSNIILHGDCRTDLPRIAAGSVDFVLTDPPYITSYKPFKNNNGQRVRNDDNAAWLEESFAEMYRVLKPDACAISFYGWPKIDLFATAWRRAGFRMGGHIVFRNPYASQSAYVQYRHESAYLLLKGKPPLPEKPVPDVLDWTYTGNKMHPTQKSVRVLMPLIESFTKPGDVVRPLRWFRFHLHRRSTPWPQHYRYRDRRGTPPDGQPKTCSACGKCRNANPTCGDRWRS